MNKLSIKKLVNDHPDVIAVRKHLDETIARITKLHQKENIQRLNKIDIVHPEPIQTYFRAISSGVHYIHPHTKWKIRYYKHPYLVYTVPSGRYWAGITEPNKYSSAEHIFAIIPDNYFANQHGLDVKHKTTVKSISGGKLTKEILNNELQCLKFV